MTAELRAPCENASDISILAPVHILETQKCRLFDTCDAQIRLEC